MVVILIVAVAIIAAEITSCLWLPMYLPCFSAVLSIPCVEQVKKANIALDPGKVLMCGLNTVPVYNNHGSVLEPCQWLCIGQDQCSTSRADHTSHSPPASKDASFVLTDTTSSYLCQFGIKTTDYLNNTVNLFPIPDMDSDAVRWFAIKRAKLALWEHVSKVSRLKIRSYYFVMNVFSLASEKKFCKL